MVYPVVPSFIPATSEVLVLTLILLFSLAGARNVSELAHQPHTGGHTGDSRPADGAPDADEATTTAEAEPPSN